MVPTAMGSLLAGGGKARPESLAPGEASAQRKSCERGPSRGRRAGRDQARRRRARRWRRRMTASIPSADSHGTTRRAKGERRSPCACMSPPQASSMHAVSMRPRRRRRSRGSGRTPGRSRVSGNESVVLGDGEHGRVEGLAQERAQRGERALRSRVPTTRTRRRTPAPGIAGARRRVPSRSSSSRDTARAACARPRTARDGRASA